MKRSYLRKRSLTKTVLKRAFRECERALIDAVNRRDIVCQLCGSTVVLQMDHAIVSRKHLSTFFEIRQMVLLCQSCHCKKTYKCNGTEILVTEIVRNREGADFIRKVVEASHTLKKWSINELEDMKINFEAINANTF